MSYRRTYDDPHTGMTSFSQVTPASPEPEELFQVRVTWRIGSTELVEGALDRATADTYASLMNRAARDLATYTVEPLGGLDYTPWHEFNRTFDYPGPAAIKIRYVDGEPVFDGFTEKA